MGKKNTNIECCKKINSDYVKISICDSNVLEHEIKTCEECPYVGQDGECSTCYGQIVVSNKKIVTKTDIKNEKEIYRNYYSIDKYNVIQEHYDYYNYVSKQNILYEIPKYDTESIFTSSWVYTERPVNHENTCKLCRQKHLRKNTITECKDNKLCKNQKQRIMYLY